MNRTNEQSKPTEGQAEDVALSEKELESVTGGSVKHFGLMDGLGIGGYVVSSKASELVG